MSFGRLSVKKNTQSPKDMRFIISSRHLEKSLAMYSPVVDYHMEVLSSISGSGSNSGEKGKKWLLWDEYSSPQCVENNKNIYIIKTPRLRNRYLQ